MRLLIEIVAAAALLFVAPNTLSAENLSERQKDECSGEFREPSKPEDKLFFGFGLGMYAAAAGDLASTEWALSQPGIVERNPLMTERSIRVATHIVAPTVAWWATDWIQKQGHRKTALLIRIGLTAGYTYLTVHNLHVAMQ